MPEGPELHLASLFVNRTCEGLVFSGPVQKSEVSKSPDVSFSCEAYRITATSRGKEVKVTLTPIKTDESKPRGNTDRPLDIVFRFGMSGFFRFTAEDELPKHAHLRFYTKETPCRVLSFVDARRFGSWQPDATWNPDRGPCIMFEYQRFRENVVSHISDRAFDRPICEVLLNQKYFNGIGNYLRAEILFRLRIPPFVSARTALEGLESEDLTENIKPVKVESADVKSSGGKIVKEEESDLLRLCHTVPLEVVGLGGKGYDPEKSDYSGFKAWLQCYYVDGMKSIRDHNSRTMWFSGDPGPLAPKVLKSPKTKKRIKKENEHDYTQNKKVARNGSKGTVQKIKQEGETKTEKKVRPKRSKTKEVETVQRTDASSTRQRKSSSAELTAPQRRSLRRTK
ncbi:endonuclease 8-like 1 isoform X2 [Gouania willdenowi]|uniref:endonuclease 8-like 1 isoform X2 n=1 Tax=Gouania willdenowi TaxID=441366 RepID=UPI00105577AB|nr:endonuclease 8-like 1 isoform X2 [Gouania willdenowi]